MSIQIVKAQRKRAKLRIGLSGPSGSGKTYSALLLGRGLATAWDKVLVIDSENGSGELYSDLGEYNVITLRAPFTPESYIEAIKAAEEAGMEVIVIDSTSHEWDGKGGCLEINELIAKTKFKGNTWSAWSETTVRHQRFIEAIVQSSCHIITTARSKTDTIQTEDKKIKKVGLKEIQREGFEYELTANFTIDREGHYAIASKDRTGLFIDRDPFIISEKTGAEFLKWNESGVDAPLDVVGLKSKVMHNLKRLGFGLMLQGPAAGKNILDIVLVLIGVDMTNERALPEAVRKLEGITDPEGAQATYGIVLEERAKETTIEVPADINEEPVNQPEHVSQ